MKTLCASALTPLASLFLATAANADSFAAKPRSHLSEKTVSAVLH